MMMVSKIRWLARFAVSLALACLLCICGCSSDPDKTSLFDHDHETPRHWPRSLGDTSAKIRERLDKLDANSNRIVQSGYINNFIFKPAA